MNLPTAYSMFKIKQENLPIQGNNPYINPPEVNENIEKDRDVYSYYRTQILQPSSGYSSDIIIVNSPNVTRFDINPALINMKTISLSFQIKNIPTQTGYQGFIPNYYFPWIKSFKVIAQPNSTELFRCDNVSQYTLMSSILNLNHNKRRREEGLIVPSIRYLCGTSTYIGLHEEAMESYQVNLESTGVNARIMPNNTNDLGIGYYSQKGQIMYPFTINIKLSDLFFDSIFNKKDILWKYGFYILIEWNIADNIYWAINSDVANSTLPSYLNIPGPPYLNNNVEISNISLQIDQQQNEYLIQQAENEAATEKIETLPFIYEYQGANAANILIFQLMNQSNYPQKLYKLYTSLLYSIPDPGIYSPLTNGNIYAYNTELLLYATPIQCGYYNEVKLFIENKLFDDIYIDNIGSQNMLLRKLNKDFKNNSYSNTEALLSICNIPFKFDDVRNDCKLYIEGESKGIDISKKILPLKIEYTNINQFPDNSFIKAICVVLRSYKYHNAQWDYA